MQSGLLTSPSLFSLKHPTRRSTRRCGPVASLAALDGEQDHYAVLGLTSGASHSDVKRAYRLLALKFHPDVSKELKANETFKSIKQAYEVLSDERLRAIYDDNIKLQDSCKPYKGNYGYAPRHGYAPNYGYTSKYATYAEDDKPSDVESEMKEGIFSDERDSTVDVAQSVYLMLFFLLTLGARVALTFCCFVAMLDKNLDAGYKLGFLTAWILGGRTGVLLSLSLIFISWLCGKTSSNKVAVVLVAIWVGTNLSRFAPFPPGAVVTMLYMSIKLQLDLS